MALAAAISFNSCKQDDNTSTDNGSGDGDKTGSAAFSIKYDEGDNCYTILTVSDDGSQKRLDHFWEYEDYQDEDGNQLSEPIKHVDHAIYLRSKEGNFVYDTSEEAEWIESINGAIYANTYHSEHKNFSKYYIQYSGFTETGTEKILGFTCKKYAGVRSEEQKVGHYGEFGLAGAKLEIVVANDLVFRLAEEYWVTDDQTVMRDVLKAVAYTTKVPDKAFTKTLDIDWIK